MILVVLWIVMEKVLLVVCIYNVSSSLCYFVFIVGKARRLRSGAYSISSTSTSKLSKYIEDIEYIELKQFPSLA